MIQKRYDITIFIHIHTLYVYTLCWSFNEFLAVIAVDEKMKNYRRSLFFNKNGKIIMLKRIIRVCITFRVFRNSAYYK